MQRFSDKVNLHSQIISEIKSGKKRTHWMWFAFPQIRGLGRSEIAQFYAIKNKEQAIEFANHDILGCNLRELCRELLNLETNSAKEIFGEIDALKLKSSMTLFYTATHDKIFKMVLDKFYTGELCDKSIV
ncbi:MAG: DUF1810 family protein [Clostridia bacterium]